MNNRELDNFFKNKLEALQKQPSTGAWDKIQVQTTPKHKKRTWFYASAAAAAILLSLLAGLFTGDRSTVDNAQLAMDEHVLRHESQQQTRAIEKRSITPHDAERTTPKDSRKTPKSISNNGQHTKPVKPNGHPSKTTDQSLPSGHQKHVTKERNSNNQSSGNRRQIKTHHDRSLESMQSDHQAKSTGDREINNRKGRTLIFDIEDFDAKIETAATNEKAEASDEQLSTLKKVVGFVHAIKEIDSGLGELREAKNNLFALNFKKENNKSK